MSYGFFILGLAHQFVAWLIPFRRQSHPIEWRWDLAGAVITVTFSGLFFAFIALPISKWAAELEPTQQWYAYIDTAPWWVLVVINLIVADLLLYWMHRLLHTSWLWRLHAWHHSLRNVWWVSGMRGNPIHVMLMLVPATCTTLIFPTITTGTVIAILTFIKLSNQHWQHSNIRLPYARQLEYFMVTPRYHFVHHSADPKFSNSNYGFLTTAWDRLFGTFVDPDTVPEDEPLGLNYENSHWRLFAGLHPKQHSSAVTVSPSSGHVE